MKQLTILIPVVIFNLLSSSCSLTPVEHPQRELTGDLRVHDPVMIKQDTVYYVFSTGHGVSILQSYDRAHWERTGRVFTDSLEWWKDDIPEQRGHLWAPDIHYRDGKYHLYYSVSAWMNFNSSIGYATNTTLDKNDPNYQWIDHGKVIDFRNGGEGVNVIDPNIFVEENGRVWLFYGSYQAGLRAVEINPATGKLFNEDAPELTLITPSLGEGVYILKRGDYHYIFASRGICCRGLDSDYHVVMGRSKDLLGPYLNKEGESWTEDKWSLLLEGDETAPGKGHNGFFTENDTTFMVYHAYSVADEGTPMLRIKPMYIDQDGWPSIEPTNEIFFSKGNLKLNNP